MSAPPLPDVVETRDALDKCIVDVRSPYRCGGRLTRAVFLARSTLHESPRVEYSACSGDPDSNRDCNECGTRFVKRQVAVNFSPPHPHWILPSTRVTTLDA